MLQYRFQTLAVEASHASTEIFENMPRLNSKAAMEIEMAVEEASVNAIKHAHQNNHAKPLRLQIKIDKQKLTALVKDQGQGFDPKKLDGQNSGGSCQAPKRRAGYSYDEDTDGRSPF